MADIKSSDKALEASNDAAHVEKSGATKDALIEDVVHTGSVPAVANEKAGLDTAKNSAWEVDALINQLEDDHKTEGYHKGVFDLEFKTPKRFTITLVIFASMGGLLSGLDQSLISGANLFLPKDLGLSDSQNSLVNGGMPLGAVFGALLLSPLNEWFGRRWSIIISCILYTVGAGLEAGSINFGMIVAARFVLGVGVGLESGTVPVYVAETVERRLRGNLVSLYQLNIALGEVLGYAVAAMFIKVPGNWRYILGSSVIFSTVMGLGMLFLPESPRFLVHKGKTLEAFKVWKRIRGIETPESRQEFFDVKIAQEQEDAEIAAGTSNRMFPWMDFFTVPRARRALIYANIMIMLGQLTGINAILYYMSVLMSQIGFNDLDATYMSLVGGGALLFGTIPAVLYMERAGRRFWAMAMLPCFFIGLVMVGVSYELKTVMGQQGLYLTGLIIYNIFFGSYACLTWVVPSEVYPTYLRSYGMTTSDALLFLCSFVVTFNFSKMQASMTRIGLTLGFYGGIAVVGWLYQLALMPETRGKTLEEIDLIFQRPTREIVAENWANAKETTRDLLALRIGKACGFVSRKQSQEDEEST
ncbi:hypothetical protein IWX90DRAFT_45993 [Phyllosticta citrichinensis]|uniref:Major facilitator superfamily (MFS) profile domain-containing protein n=1 Tax=Phyllosticta citrichinensis TaxID=1130410 RepID=A0ABR1XHZ9_9PEZI